jgi:beta-mannosidase
MHVDGPELWWPSGHGKPVLYDLEAQWVDAEGRAGDSLVRRIGLRTVELVTRKDRSPDGKRGESFAFRVNGRMVYAKGANWIPVDQYVERCTDEVYEHLLRSAAEANMNMIRVWGGGWYEKEVFYELCDELGLMVWQDFMMACALYPDTRDFISEIEREARFQMRRLADHPCIALWCGDNENAEGVVAWWKRQPHAERNHAIYAKVMTALRDVAEAEDPTRRFWLSSPSNDELGDAHPSDPTRGDVHYWAVWHGGKPFENYLEVKPRFASEFGFQSFPEARSVREVVSKGERNPSSWVMEHHQRSGNGNVLITNTMARELPIPRDFEAFCWLSQVNQAQAIRTAVEHWRRLKPWCMGAIFWQINDIWPVASWSSIDYRGRWKVLHHFSRRFFAPVLASFERKDGELHVWVTSDVNEALPIDGTLSSYTWDGARVASVPVKGKLRSGESRALARVPIDRLVRGRHPREICCFVELETPAGMAQNHGALVPLKWAALARPELSSSLREGRGGRLELVVKSSTVTPFFHAELTGLEGHFEDDWQVLRPGRRYAFGWVPHVERGGVTPSLTEARRRLETLTLHDLFVS